MKRVNVMEIFILTQFKDWACLTNQIPNFSYWDQCLYVLQHLFNPYCSKRDTKYVTRIQINRENCLVH